MQQTKYKQTEIGEIPEDWDLDTLDKLTAYINRGSPPSYTDKKTTVVINQKCVREGVVSYNEARFTDIDIKPVIVERYLRPLDILINSTGEGTLGRVGQITSLSLPTTVDSHLTIVRPDGTKIDPTFLGFYLKGLQSQIENMAEGSTGQTELAREKIKTIVVPVPQKIEQTTIAKILSSIDYKIELSRKMNKTLEEIGKALFKRWFVDFEFPFDFAQGKPNYDGKPLPVEALAKAGYKSSGGEMVDSELGEIPKEWKAGNIKDILELIYGKSLPERDRADGFIPVIGSNGITGYHNKALVKGPGIVIGRKGTIGNTIWIDRDFYPIDTTFYIRSKLRTEGLCYHYFLLQNQHFENLSFDSAVPGLNRNSANLNSIVVPTENYIMKFNLVCESLFRMRKISYEEISNLAQIRDSLLPRLISGKLRVN